MSFFFCATLRTTWLKGCQNKCIVLCFIYHCLVSWCTDVVIQGMEKERYLSGCLGC